MHYQFTIAKEAGKVDKKSLEDIMETLIQRDLNSISEVIKDIFGLGIEDIRTKGRSTAERMMAKVAICYYMTKRKHSVNVIAKVIHRSRYTAIYALKKHNDLIFSDAIYRRLIAEADERLLKRSDAFLTDVG